MANVLSAITSGVKLRKSSVSSTGGSLDEPLNLIHVRVSNNAANIFKIMLGMLIYVMKQYC